LNEGAEHTAMLASLMRITTRRDKPVLRALAVAAAIAAASLAPAAANERHVRQAGGQE